jgi:hypothetical protein
VLTFVHGGILVKPGVDDLNVVGVGHTRAGQQAHLSEVL